jgi:dTMP kinase
MSALIDLLATTDLEPFPLAEPNYRMIREDRDEAPPRGGKFVVFDGIDGTGKTTLVDIAKRFLESLGVVVRRTKQPGGSAFGDKVRQILFEEPGSANIEPTALEALFLANHLHNCREVEAALAAGEWVVADRWSQSAIPYAQARGDARADVRALYQKLVPLVRWDLFFLMLDDPFKAGARANARANAAGATETHQSKKKWNDPNVQARVQNEFLKMFGADPRTEKVWFEDRGPVDLFEKRIAPGLKRLFAGRSFGIESNYFEEALDLFVNREYQR